MRSTTSRTIAVIVLSILTLTTADSAETDDDIARTLVQASIAIYDKACACPYHLNSKGQECARTSAYRRDNGGKLLCYRSDVTPR